MLQGLAVVGPLADLHLPNLLLKLLECLAELTQVATLFPSLLEVVGLGLADLGGAGREKGFVLCVPCRYSRDVRIVCGDILELLGSY